jgi:hypothetical protein
MAIWYILWSFGIFLFVLVFRTKKNLATLDQEHIFKEPASAPLFGLAARKIKV